MSPGPNHYKVKLSSGRVLGPLDLDRVRKLILKKHITGVEVARDSSHSEWIDINRFPKIAELLILHAQGKLTDELPLSGEDEVDPYAATRILPPEEPLLNVSPIDAIVPEEQPPKLPAEPTQIVERPPPEARNDVMVSESFDDEPDDSPIDSVDRDEKTVVLDRVAIEKKKKAERRKPIRTLLILVVIVLVVQQMQKEEEEIEASKRIDLSPVRARLPSYVASKSNPVESQRLYQEAMKHYVLDHVQGYKNAVILLQKSISLDTANVKAISMLASSYINLMDVSNKDEEYFSIVSKLLENVRSKSLDLAESTIADAEFLITLGRAVSAEQRIVEYTQRNSTKDFVLFYYLANAYYHRGDYESAAKFLSLYPEDKIFSPKVYYLRGRVAEAFSKPDQALVEYGKAVKLRNDHAKSRLRIAQILDQRGKLGDAASQLDFLRNNHHLLAPADLAEVFYLRSRFLSGIQQRPDLAIAEIEQAVSINRKKHEYRLEYFTVMSQAGKSDQSEAAKREAKMFYYLSEGEKAFLSGNYDEALVQYLSARDVNTSSFHPLVKIGEMFTRQNKLKEARDNFALAVEKAPQSAEAWSRYAASLIRHYEWTDAERAIQRLSELNVVPSVTDRLRGDYYNQQDLTVDAQAYYKQSMAREPVDAAVYTAYANNLMKLKKFKEAPFYYALALRFDAQNFEAFSGTARAVAELDSPEQSITMIQDEIKRKNFPASELYGVLAEIQIKSGNAVEAQANLKKALAIDPEYPKPYRILGDYFASQISMNREAKKKALDAYQAYSDRLLSDPTGYLERYKIFLASGEFKLAQEELDKIGKAFPRFLNLHYFYGILFSQVKDRKRAAEEFSLELKLNPHNVTAILALGREMADADPKTALGLFMKAMQLSPQSAGPKYWAGYANSVLKNYHGAVALYRSALAIDNTDALIYKRLAQAYFELGDRENARIYALKYIDMSPDAPDRAEMSRFVQ